MIRPAKLTGIFLLLFGCLAAEIPAENALMLLQPTDSRYSLEGRFDRADHNQPVIIWAGNRISLDFGGGEVAVKFGQATGQNFFDLTVDGITEIVGVPSGPGYRFVWPHPLGEGRHRWQLIKRSEADAGHVVFLGLELVRGTEAWAPTPPSYSCKIEFFGDSITVGACNEDGAADQWDDRRSHNHLLSYGWLTAQALGADERAIAVSGMGIAEGYVEMKAGEVWDRIYPRAGAARADLETWRPDVVFINFGENDDSFPRNQQRPFPPGYANGYIALVGAVRTAYPRATIVLLRGGMFGGAKSPALRTAWEKVVQAVEAADPAITHYVFAHWSDQHPRVSDHRAMAAELTDWLKRQSFMDPFLKRTQ